MKNSFVALYLCRNPYLKIVPVRRRRFSNEWAQREGSGKGARPFIAPKIVCEANKTHTK
jgi:hypothetical protein